MLDTSDSEAEDMCTTVQVMLALPFQKVRGAVLGAGKSRRKIMLCLFAGSAWGCLLR